MEAEKSRNRNDSAQQVLINLFLHSLHACCLLFRGEHKLAGLVESKQLLITSLLYCSSLHFPQAAFAAAAAFITQV